MSGKREAKDRLANASACLRQAERDELLLREELDEKKTIVNRARDDVRAAQRDLELLEATPPEPTRGSVIMFNVQYDEDGKVYSYVAHHNPATRCWYLTNKSGAFSWADLTDLMRRDVLAKRSGAQFYVYPNSGGEWRGPATQGC